MGELNRYSAPTELKITDIRVANIDRVPKHCILLRIDTNQGVCGYGEVRDASSATYALMLKSRLVGENPLNVQKLFERIRQFGGHSRQGGGVSGIEIALYDIIGKVYGIPVYQLLGGRYRDSVRIYCDTDVDGKHTGHDMGLALKKRMDMGFTFLKMDLGIELMLDEPGCLNAPSGMLEDIQKYSAKALRHQSGSVDMDMMRAKNYEVFTIPHYASGIHITEKGLDYLENYVREIREVIGYEVPLATDHLGHVPVTDAIALAKRLEKYNIAWMEDIAPWMYTDTFRRFADATTVPVCTGEDIYLAENFEPLLRDGRLGVVHPDLLTVGGFAEMKKLALLCDKYATAMAIHMAESPIGFMAALHAAASIRNVLAVEFHSVDCPAWENLINGPEKPLIKDGFAAVPDAPGLGIESLNEEFIEANLHSKFGPAWQSTDSWNGEWANDRTWS